MLHANRELPLAEARRRRRAWYREEVFINEVFLDFDPVTDTETEPFEDTPDPEGQPPPDGPP